MPERVAYYKLVEEMIDPIVSRGFTSLGDLRDAVSRGNLKMRDLAAPAEFFQGDRLLQADRVLAEVLDGVHRRGEIYLRWLQRFSALAFGTRLGRFLTRYVALPFGGTFVLLKGLEEISELTITRMTGHHLHLVNVESILVLGTVAARAHQLRAIAPRVLRDLEGDRPVFSASCWWTYPHGCSIIRCFVG